MCIDLHENCPNENIGDAVNSNISNRNTAVVIGQQAEREVKLYIAIAKIYEKGLPIRHMAVITVYCYILLCTVVIKVFLYNKYSGIGILNVLIVINKSKQNKGDCVLNYFIIASVWHFTFIVYFRFYLQTYNEVIWASHDL